MFNVSQAFSSSDVFGIWIDSTTRNLTGDLALTFGIGILVLIMLISLFRMPELFMVLLLAAPVVLISSIQSVGQDFNMFVGIIVLYLSFVVWSMFPGK